MVCYRHEKFVPLGGPSGGDGGRGGDVVLVADRNLSTLGELHYRKRVRAEKGRPGGPKGRTGAGGAAAEVRVPVGTVVYDTEDPQQPLIDLVRDEQRYVVAHGGKGGLGNAHFKTSRRHTPDFALPGRAGETRVLRLSLKLLADVGLIGFPNAGKSTLLRRLSAARPKVASYPFTTLTPSLGVIERGERRFVVADIPGLIEGASEGIGLGHRFLRHVERTRVLVHLLDLAALIGEGRDLERDYAAIRRELERYEPTLLARREIVVLSKVDLLGDEERIADLEAKLDRRGLRALRVSGASGKGIDELVVSMLAALDEATADESDEDASS